MRMGFVINENKIEKLLKSSQLMIKLDLFNEF